MLFFHYTTPKQRLLFYFKLCFSLPSVVTYFLSASLRVRQALYNGDKSRDDGFQNAFGKEQLLYGYTFCYFDDITGAAGPGSGCCSVLYARGAYCYLGPNFPHSRTTSLVNHLKSKLFLMLAW